MGPTPNPTPPPPVCGAEGVERGGARGVAEGGGGFCDDATEEGGSQRLRSARTVLG